MKSDRLLKIGSEILKKNNVKSHMIDTEILLSYLTGKSRESLITKPDFNIKTCSKKRTNSLSS